MKTTKDAAGLDWDTPVGIQIEERPDGDYDLCGITEKDATIIQAAFISTGYTLAGNSAIIPRDRMEMLDGNDQPVQTIAEAKSFRIDKGAIVPLEAIKKPQKKRQEPGQGAVKSYLYCLEKFLEAAQQQPRTMRPMQPGADPKEGVRLSRKLWAWMRNARIFEIPKVTFAAFHETAEQEMLDQLSDTLSGNPKPYYSDVDLLGRDIPFPTSVPFSHTYLGIGDGILLPERLVQHRVNPQFRMEIKEVRLLGYLIVEAPDPWVEELCFIQSINDNFCLPTTHYHLGSWDQGRTLTPWVINSIIELLASHRVVIDKSNANLNLRTAFKRQNKATSTKVIPPPYYTIRMTDSYTEVSTKQANGSGERSSLTYRHDREGHERVYVRRGVLPISAEDRSKLAGRGYRITTGRLSAEDSERLSKRRKPVKRVDEWVAVLSVWIDEKVIGDPSLPYIPAVRVPQQSRNTQAITRAQKEKIPSIL